MYFENLTQLVSADRRGRAYYDSLPTAVQIELSVSGDSIHTLENMHEAARSAELMLRKNILNVYSDDERE